MITPAEFPSKFAATYVKCVYNGAELYEIDKLSNIMHIRALASGIKEAQRTKRSAAYEGTTLREIATSVARRHKFTVVGEIADVRLKRITQHQEGDLAFLKRLAGNYGYVFSVKGGTLVFSKYSKLRSTSAVVTLNRVGDVVRYSLRDKSLTTYKDCECSYDDPKTKTCMRRIGKMAVRLSDRVLVSTANRHCLQASESVT